MKRTKRTTGVLLAAILWLSGAVPALAIPLEKLEVNGHSVYLQRGVTSYSVPVETGEMAEGLIISASSAVRVGGTGVFEPITETTERQVVGFDENGNVDTYTLTLVPYIKADVPAGEKVKENPLPIVALTIDDGYNAEAITRILEITKKCGVEASFFVTGACLRNNAPLWQQAVAEGHEICWHSMQHSRIDQMTSGQLKADLDAWEARAKEYLGEDYVVPDIVRLPFGAGRNIGWISRVFAQERKLSAVWDVDPFSGTGTQDYKAYAKYLLYKTKENSIILLHFNICDARALELALPTLCKSFSFRKMSDIYNVVIPQDAGPAATPPPLVTEAPEATQTPEPPEDPQMPA